MGNMEKESIVSDVRIGEKNTKANEPAKEI